ADAMLGGLAPGVLGGDLRGIGSRLAAALEAHHARRRPGNRIALRIGDGDHRIVEAGVHMRDAGSDILPLAPANALRFTCHVRNPDPSSSVHREPFSLLPVEAKSRRPYLFF